MEKIVKTYQAYWEKELFALNEWAFPLSFGFSYLRMSKSIKNVQARLKRVEKFEAQFIRICKNFKFNVKNPKYKNIPLQDKSNGPKVLISGNIDNRVAEQLLNSFVTIQDWHESVKRDFTWQEAANKKAKPGPIKPPAFFAEHVLVGISLHRDSIHGLKMLRATIEPSGKLEKWLNEQFDRQSSSLKDKKNVISLLITQTKETDINKWATAKQQTLENALLEDKTTKKTMRDGKLDPELKNIRLKIKMRVSHLKSQVAKETLQIVI